MEEEENGGEFCGAWRQPHRAEEAALEAFAESGGEFWPDEGAFVSL